MAGWCGRTDNKKKGPVGCDSLFVFCRGFARLHRYFTVYHDKTLLLRSIVLLLAKFCLRMAVGTRKNESAVDHSIATKCGCISDRVGQHHVFTCCLCCC